MRPVGLWLWAPMVYSGTMTKDTTRRRPLGGISYASVVRRAVALGANPQMYIPDGLPSPMRMLGCAMRVKNAHLCVATASAISSKEPLRHWFVTRRLGWFLIRTAHSRLVKTENILWNPAWRDTNNEWEELKAGIRAMRRLLEGWLSNSGSGRRKLPKRTREWRGIRLSPGFS